MYVVLTSSCESEVTGVATAIRYGRADANGGEKWERGGAYAMLRVKERVVEMVEWQVWLA